MFRKGPGDTVGHLVIDNGGVAGATTPVGAGAPAFETIEVRNGGTLAVGAGVVQMASALTVSAYGVFLVDRSVSVGSLRVAADGLLTHTAGHAGFDFTVSGDAVVESGAAISADGKGHASGAGLGAGSGNGSEWSLRGSGGGYGGRGGDSLPPPGTTFSVTPGGSTYGSAMEPADLGSGGGGGYGWTLGGSGGGAIRLRVDGTLQLDGRLSVNGNAAGGFYGGGGSGGSVYLRVGALQGAGVISADGGAAGDGDRGGGGGGGRIAVHYQTDSFAGTTSARGGAGRSGGAGTMFRKGPGDAIGHLVVDNGGTAGATTPIGAGAPVFESIEVRNGGTLSVGAGVVQMASALTVSAGGVFLLDRSVTVDSLRVAADGLLTHTAGQAGFDFTVSGDAVVESGAAISADGKGYGSDAGSGKGESGIYTGGGGGYGGTGGSVPGGPSGGAVYGSLTELTELGSGGGQSTYSPAAGGAGGGALRLTVGGTLSVDGKLSADGLPGPVNFWGGGGGGGGSGGSVYLRVGALAGSGVISANGGVGAEGKAGGGGGGRIAIRYIDMAAFDPGRINVQGGNGLQNGNPGTIFTRPWAPYVVSHSPSKLVLWRPDHVDLDFDSELDAGTFTTDDVTLVRPNGERSSTMVPPRRLKARSWRVGFPAHESEGEYHILVGPNIADTRGRLMNQDGDVTFGEDPEDVYDASFRYLKPKELALDVPTSGSFSFPKQPDYYYVTVASGQDLEIRLDDLDDTGANELYVSFEDTPSQSLSDYRGSAQPVADQVVRIPGTRAGTYYILVQAADVPAPGPSGYTATARYLPLTITSVEPDRAYNASHRHELSTIRGTGFDPAAAVVLRREGESDIHPTDVQWVDSATLFARFNVTGAQAGQWNAVVTNPDAQTATYPFTVFEGGAPELKADLIVSSPLGFHIPATLYINYANVGTAPMPAPLLRLQATQGTLLTADPTLPAGGLSNSVQMLGLGPGPDPALLNPGESGRIAVYYQGCQTWVSPIEFTLGALAANETTPIDWASMKEDLRPDTMAADAWDAIWPILTGQLGSTWGDYVRVLDADAAYLDQHGSRTHQVEKLLAFEIAKATGAISPRGALAVAVDAYAPGSVLPLVFARVAPQSIDQRFRLGPLGRGWWHNFEYRLTVPQAGEVVVHGPGGATRTFTDVWWQGQRLPEPGDYGELTLDADGYRLREKSGLVWRFDGAGRLDYVAETNGNRLTMSYTGVLLSSITHSNGQVLQIVYDDAGRIARVEHRLADNSVRATSYQYNGEYLRAVTDPGSVTTEYDYSPVAGSPADHALRAITFPDGTHRYYEYDALGRLIAQSRDENAERVRLSYDPSGRVQVKDALNAATSLHPGAFGELLDITDPLGAKARLRYDALLNLTGAVGPENQSAQFEYDSKSNPIRITDPLLNVISLGNTGDGSRLDWLRDARGHVTDFTTDSRGDLTQMTYPDASSELFEYDTAGNVTKVTNRRGQQINFRYEDTRWNSLVTRKEWREPWSQDPVRTTGYTYDLRGNLTSVIDSATGTIAMQYDHRDFLKRIDYPGGGPGGRWFEFEYNNAGRRTQRRGHDGYVLNYDYDTAGRLEQLTDGSGAEIIRYFYDDAGRLSRENKGNGTYTTYEYDAAGQITHMVNYGKDDAVQSRFDYVYDVNGNPTSMATLNGTWQYGYDALGQLTRVKHPDGHVVEYQYDPAGNRTVVTDNGTSTAYTTNNMNQYTQVGGASYTYDADGNMTSKTDATGTTTYTYDIENRLVRVATPTDGTREYIYDALGNRVEVKHDGVATRYLHDPIGLVDVAAEYDGNGTLVARYTHGLGLISRTGAAGNAAFYSYDAIGHTRQMTDPVGAIANSYDYDPFGGPLQANESLANTFRYIGRWGVSDDGRCGYFMRTRYYMPTSGRFITCDPAGIRGGLNLYSYCANDPVTYIDPLGLDVIRVSLPVGIVVSLGWNRASGKQYIGIGYSKGIPSPSGYLWADENDNWGINGGIQEIGSISYSSKAARSGLYAEAWLGCGLMGHVSQYLGDKQADSAFGIGWGGSAQIGVMSTMPHPLLFVFGASAIPLQAYIDYITSVVLAWDPNAKIGPLGFGTANLKGTDKPLPYVIYFENDPAATAAAREVYIIDQLQNALDPATFEFGELGFGPHVVSVPEGLQHYETRLAIDGWTWNETQGWHTGETPLTVNITVDLDAATSTATWHLQTLDPKTGLPPEDAYAGFLPPNDPDSETHRGEGRIGYVVNARPGLPSGTEIRNVAQIQFDGGEIIATNQVDPHDPSQGTDPNKEALVTIDAGAPSSQVTALPATTSQYPFALEWTGQDDANGSGVAAYDIYVSVDDGPFGLWLSTAETSAPFHGQWGHRYAFYSVGRDNVGHSETAPLNPDSTIAPDAATLVITDLPIDSDRDGDVDLDDLAAMQSCLSGPMIPLALGCEKFDLDGDNDVDQSDFGVFQRCYSGEGNPADPDCAD